MNRKAFTLIELLVVVALIGILAAVGVVAYNGYTKSAKLKAVHTNLKTVSKWLAAESAKVCSAQQGSAKNGMYLNNDDSNYRYFVKCSDDGTALAWAASHFFTNNKKFSNPDIAAQLGLIDNIIKPSDTRKVIVDSFKDLVNKGELGDKHGNIPL